MRESARPVEPAISLDHRDFVGRVGSGENKWTVAAKVNGKVVGAIDFATTEENPNRPSIEHVVVRPEYRRQGIGSLMLDRVVKEYGIDNIEWGDYATEEGQALKASIERKYAKAQPNYSEISKSSLPASEFPQPAAKGGDLREEVKQTDANAQAGQGGRQEGLLAPPTAERGAETAPPTPTSKATPYFRKAEKLEKEAAYGESIGGSAKTVAELRRRAKGLRQRGEEVAAREAGTAPPLTPAAPEQPSVMRQKFAERGPSVASDMADRPARDMIETTKRAVDRGQKVDREALADIVENDDFSPQVQAAARKVLEQVDAPPAKAEPKQAFADAMLESGLTSKLTKAEREYLIEQTTNGAEVFGNRGRKTKTTDALHKKLADRGVVTVDEGSGWAQLTPTGKRVVDQLKQTVVALREGQPIESYTPGPGNLVRKGAFFGHDVVTSKLNGKKWFSDGHFMAQGDAPSGWKVGAINPDFERVKPKAKGEPVDPIGASKLADADPLAVTFSNGASIDANYFDFINKRYSPDEWTAERERPKEGSTDKKNPLQAWKDGRLVAVVMPLRREIPAKLAERLKGEAPKATGPKATTLTSAYSYEPPKPPVPLDRAATIDAIVKASGGDKSGKLRAELEALPDPEIARQAQGVGAKASYLDRLEAEAKARIDKKLKDAGSTLSTGPGLAAELLADYAQLGAIKIAKGFVKFSDWSREMIREHGPEIQKHLIRIWSKARRIHEEQLKAGDSGSGEKPPVAREAFMPTPEPGGSGAKPEAPQTGAGRSGPPVTSPSYDLTKDNILKRVAEPVREAMQERLADFEQRNPERQKVTFREVIAEARSLGLDAVKDLDIQKVSKGGTLDPAVRFAARETVNGLNKELQAKRKSFAENSANLSPEARERTLREIEMLEQDARRLVDVLLPTRSNDGRNLAFHRIMAEGSFDVTYWLSKARRALAIPEGVELPEATRKAIEEITGAGEAAEAAAIERVTGRGARRAQAEREAKAELGPEPARVKRRTVDAAGKPLPTLEERQARYKERLLAKIEEKLAGVTTERAKSKWELSAAERAQVDADPVVRAERVKLARHLMKLEKSGLLDIIATVRRAGLLTGIRTHARNLLGNTSFIVLEELSRIPAAVVDSALATMTGRRTVQGASLDAMLKAGREGATRGIKEAKEIMRDGATEDQLAQMDLVKELNSGSKALDTYANTILRSMSAADRLFKVYAFERSMQEQMKLAKVTTPTEAMRVQAWADAQFATFNNDNLASSMLAKGKAWAKTQGDGGKLAAFAFDMAIPFARTPANVVARVIDYTPVGAGVRSAFAIRRALKAGGLTPEIQRQLSLAMGRGLVGSAIMLIGYKLADGGVMTGISEKEPGKRAVEEAAGRMYGSILIDGKWHRVDALSPLGNLLVLGASLRRGEDKGMEAVAKTAAATVLEQPMMQGTKEVLDAIQEPGSRGKSLTASLAGSMVPTMVADVASLGDDKRRDSRADTTLEATRRAILARVPGARNTLPPRVDVLGNEQPQTWQAVLTPTIGSKDKTRENLVLRELVDNEVSMGFRKRAEGESEALYRARIKAEGEKIQTRLGWSITTPYYRGLATKQERQDYLEKQIRSVRSAEPKPGKR